MGKKATRKIILFFFLIAATVICIMTACDSTALRGDHGEIHSRSGQASPTTSEQKLVATKIVSHSLGQTEIPLHPERIVVLDAYNELLLDGLLALGIKPIGLARCSSCVGSDPFSDVLGDLPSIGTGQQPSLEKILSLKPDLILGYRWQKAFYPQLSKIAPTVMIDNFTGGNDFKRNFKKLAEILGENDQAEDILAEYNERIQNFRKQFEERLKTKTVSLLMFYEAGFHVYGPKNHSFAGVMLDAGIQFISAYKELESDALFNMSLEALPDWDADFLFIGLYHDKDSPDELKSVFKQPLWSTLKAVRNEQVYIITKIPSGGPIGTNQFIDELSEYFSTKL
ncbi:MAG: iron-siderophore ABC transporter substrate-binding protein [Cyanobacteria bacterium P01_F01_bin.86]